jgi:hypothetical protein
LVIFLVNLFIFTMYIGSKNMSAFNAKSLLGC